MCLPILSQWSEADGILAVLLAFIIGPFGIMAMLWFLGKRHPDGNEVEPRGFAIVQNKPSNVSTVRDDSAE